MAFAADSFSISRMASLVGTMINSTWRRSASRFTSFITGKRPYAPVPIKSRWHFHGIFSSIDKGVCPNSSRNLLEGDFAFADLPAVDHHVLLVRAAVDSNGAEGKFIEVHTRLRTVALRRSS